MPTESSLQKVQPVVNLITNSDAEAARKIKMLLPYGSKLTDENALALAAYSRLHGLDPFNGECYFLVKEKLDDHGNVIKREELGVYPGIRGKRKVAKQQLSGFDPSATYKIDYFVVGPEAVGLKPQPGEIAIVVEAQLRDTVSTQAYLSEFYKLQALKADPDLIKAVLGKPPVWIGFGVVKSFELRYIKQSPMQLAKKRAESDATNQRFDLPFSDDALADDIAPELVGELENGISNDSEPVINVSFTEAPKITTEQALADLGFGPDPVQEPVPDPAPADIEEPGDYEPAEPEMPEPPVDPAPAAEPYNFDAMTLGDAKSVVAPNGKMFGTLKDDELATHFVEIQKFIKAGCTDEQRVKFERSLFAIRLILAAKKTSYLLQTKS